MHKGKKIKALLVQKLLFLSPHPARYVENDLNYFVTA